MNSTAQRNGFCFRRVINSFFSDELLKLLVVQQNADAEFLSQAKGYCERSLKQLFMWANELSGNDPLFILRPRSSTSEMKC
jgi:hypothetical protein